MALTDEEKEKVRYHLGYLSVQPASAIQLGFARPIQTLFLVEQAMVNILAVAEPRIRKTLCVLDGVEDRLIKAQARLVAASVEDIKLRDDEPDALEAEYVRWAQRLADILGVPLYPFSARFKNAGAVAAGSIPVRR